MKNMTFFNTLMQGPWVKRFWPVWLTHGEPKISPVFRLMSQTPPIYFGSIYIWAEITKPIPVYFLNARNLYNCSSTRPKFLRLWKSKTHISLFWSKFRVLHMFDLALVPLSLYFWDRRCFTTRSVRMTLSLNLNSKIYWFSPQYSFQLLWKYYNIRSQKLFWNGRNVLE